MITKLENFIKIIKDNSGDKNDFNHVLINLEDRLNKIREASLEITTEEVQVLTPTSKLSRTSFREVID